MWTKWQQRLSVWQSPARQQHTKSPTPPHTISLSKSLQWPSLGERVWRLCWLLLLVFASGSPTFSYSTTPTNNTPPQQPRLQVKAGETTGSPFRPCKCSQLSTDRQSDQFSLHVFLHVLYVCCHNFSLCLSGWGLVRGHIFSKTNLLMIHISIF